MRCRYRISISSEPLEIGIDLLRQLRPCVWRRQGTENLPSWRQDRLSTRGSEAQPSAAAASNAVAAVADTRPCMLDRFPVSPSPCCRRSLFAGTHLLQCVGCGSGTRTARPSAAVDDAPGCANVAGRMPVATAAAGPAERYLRRVLQPGSGCRVSPSWLSFCDNQIFHCNQVHAIG